jgi:hypothetical protein
MEYLPLPIVFPVLYCERGEDGERLELGSEKVGCGLYTWEGTVCESCMMFVSACGRDWIETKQERAKVSAEDLEMSHPISKTVFNLLRVSKKLARELRRVENFTSSVRGNHPLFLEGCPRIPPLAVDLLPGATASGPLHEKQNGDTNDTRIPWKVDRPKPFPGRNPRCSRSQARPLHTHRSMCRLQLPGVGNIRLNPRLRDHSQIPDDQDS